MGGQGTAVQVSFCATNLQTLSTLPQSLESIERIGRFTATPFEIVVADGPSDPAVQRLLAEWSAEGTDRIIVRHTRRSRGYGRQRAFEASSGRYIVPFDTSIAYNELCGALLARYLGLNSDRMLFSELCALSRASVISVGGWRDLIGGEDVDVYAPVAERFGVIAYPTGDPGSQSRVLSSFGRQMRYAHGSRVRRLYRMLLTQRDQILGANFRVSDLMEFNRRKPLGVRCGAWLWFSAAATLAAVSRVPRRKVDAKNNYLYFREQTVLSILRGDYRELRWAEGPPPQLPLTPDEMDYLRARSKVWGEAARSHPELFPEKGR